MLIIKKYLRFNRLKNVSTALTVIHAFDALQLVAILITMQQAQTIQQYLETLPEGTQAALRDIQSIIKKIVPDAQETISYGVPTFRQGKSVIHAGGYEQFVSLYPGAAGVAAFSDQLKTYETSKGTVRFYLDKPLPRDLIEQMVRFCFKEVISS